MSATALRVPDDQWYQYATDTNELARATTKPVVVARPQLSSPTVVHRSKWAKPTIDRLVALTPLRDNWDNRGSAAVRADVLTFAWNVLAQIMPDDGVAPVIVPIGNGGVQLEWSSERADLEIEIARPYEMFALLFENRDGDDVETALPTDNWEHLMEVVRDHFRN
jgi:hypothetical protein